MDYEKEMKSIGSIGVDIDYTPPDLTVAYQEGITQKPKISYKQGVAFKPKFVQFTIDTTVPGTFQFWAPDNFNVNPN